VLAGVVGAFLAGLPATGGDAFGAAVAAVHAHAAAGDRAARGRDRGVLASDVADALPDAVADLVRSARRGRAVR
jgi:NAD(P)H-hydrate repair Nnr-like enzyme with NAD(P)H-hydrate dehydratase domain